ncbi:unnamed protein product [Rotaria sordida]|uniref:Uncharacterized protein n=1 Tax=Rotaria sordida TaxID=392033 RepID=A0A818W4V1_9BILA|nr:unnamed protein product [Rotaria sordida]CAF3719819.1 unnamed protein product [Rotaria sordida]
MSIKYIWRHLLCLMKMFILIFVILLYYNDRIKQNKTLPLKLSCLNVNKTKYESEISIFKLRLNQRLFHLGQRFSHININKLLHIQSSSTKTFTYFCSKFCGGWGDRLRGITSAYILAVLLQRRFVIDMQYPCNLTNFLLPNLIDWKPIYRIHQQKNSLKLDIMYSKYADKVISHMATDNLTQIWLNYDNIFFTTNNDLISIVLKNPFFKLIKSQINIQSNESTQQELFPFLFEFLFKPTSIIINKIDELFLKSSLYFNQSIICMHIRIGQSLTLRNDKKLPFRQSIVHDMLEFIDKNLTDSYSSIFVTSDSYQIQQDIYKHYGNNRLLSVSGPIIHIDRLNTKMESNETLYHGFVKVISDFYFLGECDTLLRPRSGFSEWAGRRRLKEYSNLYIYCRGIHRVTSSKWRRPYNLC